MDWYQWIIPSFLVLVIIVSVVSGMEINETKDKLNDSANSFCHSYNGGYGVSSNDYYGNYHGWVSCCSKTLIESFDGGDRFESECKKFEISESDLLAWGEK